MRPSPRKYIIAFIITAAIFTTAFYVAARFNAARVADITATEQQISIDILSSETEYDILGQLDCSQVAQDPVLSDELNSLASRLSYAENNLGSTNPQVVVLKEQYSLLEIKDYLLMQKVTLQCGIHPVFILYFYSNEGNCPDCAHEGDVLTYLRETYPELRVYSFDYNLNLSALKALIDVRHIAPKVPALVINNRPAVYGFKNVDNVLSIAPEIKKLATTSAATSSTAGF